MARLVTRFGILSALIAVWSLAAGDAGPGPFATAHASVFESEGQEQHGAYALASLLIFNRVVLQLRDS